MFAQSWGISNKKLSSEELAILDKADHKNDRSKAFQNDSPNKNNGSTIELLFKDNRVYKKLSPNVK